MSGAPRIDGSGRGSFPLAFEYELQSFAKVCLGIFECLALGNCRRDLLHKEGVATLFGRLENGGEFHAARVTYGLAPGLAWFSRVGVIIHA
jgi:hypothetical protein